MQRGFQNGVVKWSSIPKLLSHSKRTQLPLFAYYGYCHSLDGDTLFSKVDSNKLCLMLRI